MGKPAVTGKQLTAGKKTQKTKLWKSMVSVLLLTCWLMGVPIQAAREPQTTRTVTTTERVPFDTTYIDLPERYKGYSEKISDGSDGTRKVEVQVVYEGSRPVKVLGIKSSELSSPVNAVVRRGTKEVRTQTVDGSPWQYSFINPLKDQGWISADFYDYPGHNGLDIAAPYGTPVYASAGGTVTLAGWFGEYGHCIIVRHPDGSEAVYAHNSRLMVSRGQTIKQGQKIAEVGSTGNSTGNHLHFEIRSNGAFLNPLTYIDQ